MSDAMAGLRAAPGRRDKGALWRGGGARPALLSLGFAALFASGLFLWLVPDAGLVVIAHLAVGLLFVVALAGWLAGHVRQGRGKSQRRSYSAAAWGLLALYGLVLGSGLAMAAPAALWLAGRVWMLPDQATAILSFAHFWGSWLALSGLLVHLAMRHWRA